MGEQIITQQAGGVNQAKDINSLLPADTAQPSLSARISASGGQSVPSNTETQVNFGTINYNNGGIVNTGNNDFKIPVGIITPRPFLVIANLNFAGVVGATTITVRFYKNSIAPANLLDTQQIAPLSIASTTLTVPASSLVQVTGNDIVLVTVQASISINLNPSATNSTFAIAKITNQGIDGPEGRGYAATSTTSHTIGASGSITLIPDAAGTTLAYKVGSRVKITSAANPTIYDEFLVTAFNSLTNVMTFGTPYNSGIAGTASDWTVTITGARGVDGTNPSQAVSAKVFHNTTQSITADNTFRTIAFNDEIADASNMHDNTTNNSRITSIAARAMIFQATVTANTPNSGRSYRLRILKNGTTVIAASKERADDNTLGDTSETSELIIVGFDPSAAIGDYYEVQAAITGGGSATLNGAAVGSNGGGITTFSAVYQSGSGQNGINAAAIIVDNGDDTATITVGQDTDNNGIPETNTSQVIIPYGGGDTDWVNMQFESGFPHANRGTGRTVPQARIRNGILYLRGDLRIPPSIPGAVINNDNLITDTSFVTLVGTNEQINFSKTVTKNLPAAFPNPSAPIFMTNVLLDRFYSVTGNNINVIQLTTLALGIILTTSGQIILSSIVDAEINPNGQSSIFGSAAHRLLSYRATAGEFPIDYNSYRDTIASSPNPLSLLAVSANTHIASFDTASAANMGGFFINLDEFPNLPIS